MRGVLKVLAEAPGEFSVKIKRTKRPNILWRGRGIMGIASVSADIVIIENFGGNCSSKVVTEEDRSPMSITCRRIG